MKCFAGRCLQIVEFGLTVKVCACAECGATIVSAQSSISADVVRRRRLQKIDVESWVGLVMIGLRH